MNLLPNKRDAYPKPIVDTRISASEWNQLVGSCMAFITEAGFTPDASDNEQFLNAFKAIAASLELIGANTNLSNLTATGEAKFDAKVNLDGSNATFPHITETYSSGTDWYRVWSDGWCEQGGTRSAMSSDSSLTINLLKPFVNTNYFVFEISTANNTSSDWASNCRLGTKSQTQFVLFQDTGGDRGGNWEAKGYIS